MKRTITLLSMGLALIGHSQAPNIDSWMLNTTGTLASYEYYPAAPPTTSTVNMTDSADILRVCYDNNYVYIRTNGLASYTMGPWEMNPNVPSAIDSRYRFPRYPQEETGTRVAQPSVGSLGVAVNGVKLYGCGDARSYNSSTGQNDGNGDGLWNGDAWASEGETMDPTGAGHPDQGGNYHYHATPIWLYQGPTNVHSPIVGWAFDGFPIYGPYGYSDSLDDGSPVVRMESSYHLRTMSDRTVLPDGTTSSPPGPAINATFPLGTYWEDYEYETGYGHLDTFNGRWCVTPEFPSGTYAYFVTMDGSGEPAFPYLMGLEYYGEVNAADIGGPAGNITIPGGVTCLGTNSIEEKEEVKFTVYPNPAKAFVSINGITINGQQYAILDQLGRTVQTGILDQQISVETLNPGTYFMKIQESNQVIRFIKE